ncbi:MAG: ABC transporter ATP-binding protein [Planctomycetaceae bacterium]|nr:ABC transporter ATP-binding protein [Planctomycetaceae bacterium]
MSHLSKEYALVSRLGQAMWGNRSRNCKKFLALDDVSFEVDRGQVMGVIGANGAGKSTLLKVLSGVSNASAGQVRVGGHVSGILEVATGFVPELSGRDNIRRRLALQGCTRKEVRRLEPEIIEFSELEEVIDRKVITYSSGMAAKLVFSVVTASPAEVLLIDELLVVGDEHFQGRSIRRIKDLCCSGRTVVIASHDIGHLERLCDRAIWLEKGRIRMSGEAHEVGMQYYRWAGVSAESSYPRQHARIESLTAACTDGQMRIEAVVSRLMSGSTLHFQVAVHDVRLGMMANLFSTAHEKIALPEGVGPARVAIGYPAPPGLRKGLVGAAVLRGTGALRTDVMEDAWGWDNGKHVYFTCPGGSGESYVNEPLRWRACS